MEFATAIVNFLSQGGTAGLIVVLVVFVGILIYERRLLNQTLESTTNKVYEAKDSETQSIKNIVERYHQGNLDLVQALNEIKIVLTTIQTIRKHREDD